MLFHILDPIFVGAMAGSVHGWSDQLLHCLHHVLPDHLLRRKNDHGPSAPFPHWDCVPLSLVLHQVHFQQIKEGY